MKNKYSQNLVQYLLIALTAMLMVSCKSDAYYKERAVDNARQYLLKHSKELSQVQREYIKYNKPVLLYKDILNQLKTMTDQYQICITWQVPGEADAFLVYGTGNYHMRNWSPLRLVKKQFSDKDKARRAAMNAAVHYVMNNMLFLSNNNRNIIRFATPKFAITNFTLDRQSIISKKDEFGKAKSMKQLAKERATLAKQEQVSLIYTTDNDAKQVVVLGVSGPALRGWQPVTGIETTPEDLKQHTIASL